MKNIRKDMERPDWCPEKFWNSDSEGIDYDGMYNEGFWPDGEEAQDTVRYAYEVMFDEYDDCE